LLGEYSDEEEQTIGNNNHFQDSTEIQSTERRPHKESTQRGPLDIYVDNQLDHIQYTIPIKKFGKNDGIYLFGARMMKAKNNSGNVGVFVGNQMMTIANFVNKFEKVESKKMKGLEGVQGVCSILGQISFDQLQVKG